MFASGENVALSADTSYVVSTFEALSTVTPTQTQIDQYARDLRDVVSRVSVVEDVALSRAPASFWMSGVDAGGSPTA